MKILDTSIKNFRKSANNIDVLNVLIKNNETSTITYTTIQEIEKYKCSKIIILSWPDFIMYDETSNIYDILIIVENIYKVYVNNPNYNYEVGANGIKFYDINIANLDFANFLFNEIEIYVDYTNPLQNLIDLNVYNKNTLIFTSARTIDAYLPV